MAREWNTVCQDCGRPFSYSGSTEEAARQRGEAPPGICSACTTEFLRERRSIPRAHLLGGLADPSQALARLDGLVEAEATAQDHEPILEQERGKFGVSDEKLLEFYRKLDDPLTQVILVEAPTGAGKSTFFPYRLLVPPEGVSAPDVFTRNGQIVVTQPRVQATRNIPGYVARLYGCRVGAGFDIGFRHAKEHAADGRCKLVYLTDGTLVNWIASGQLGNISLVMLDEAHERSLTIDLIIGLLTKMLPRYPWLKLVIASATIDCDKFRRFFDRHLRGGTRCEHVVFEGKPDMPIRKHFRCGHAEWHDRHGQAHVLERDAPTAPLPYLDADLKPLLTRLPVDVGDKCIELLERMHPSDDSLARGVPNDLVEKRGDVLAFLYGEKSITEALNHIRQYIEKSPVLKGCVQLLPLHSKLPAEEQRKALVPPTEGVTRVIISTNVAETSLTIQGIKHVVETGLINRNLWDTASETGAVRQQLHSQAGCKQRWGRAGRVTEGDAWCIYTREQYERFPTDTMPAILSSRLEQVVLQAKFAGVDRLDAESFPWVDPPPAEELTRALQRLQQIGALDKEGDITAHGIEIQRFGGGGDPRSASLLLLADRFACAVEMATILPLIDAGGRGGLLVTNRDWDETTLRQVRQVHAALTRGCRDDLELVLKIYAAWSEARAGGPTITGNWAWNEIWPLRRTPLPAEVRASLPPETADHLEKCVAEARDRATFEALLAGEVASSAVRAWLTEQRELFSRAAAETWARLWCVNDAILVDLEKGRDERIDMLAVRKKDKERRPINFEALDRVRALLVWACPDLCFLDTHEDRNGKPCYERLADVREADLHEQDRANAAIESDDGDEDEWVKPAIVLQISDRSACHNQRLDALVGFGSQRRVARPHPNAEDREFTNPGFVIEVDRAWTDDLTGLDMMGLAAWLARKCPPVPPGDHPEGGVRRRLFIDQRYPVFTQVRYRPVRQLDESRWEVEVVEALNHWPLSRAPLSATLDAEEDDGEVSLAPNELCTDIIVGVLNEEGVPRVDPTEATRADDTDDSDLEPDTNEDAEATPARQATTVSELNVPRPLPFRATLILTQATAPAEQIAEVVTYTEEDDGPRLVLETPTPELCFDQFYRRYQVGQRVSVEALGSRRVAGAGGVSLRVREPESGLELEVFPEDLAFVRVPDLLDDLVVGSRLELIVDAIDPRTLLVRLTALPLLEELQASWREGRRGELPGTGRIFEMTRDRVRFRINRSPIRPDQPLPPLRFPTAELHQHEGKGRVALQCELGRECNLRYTFAYRVSSNLRVIPEKMPEIVSRLVALWGERIEWTANQGRLTLHCRHTGPMTGKMRCDALALSEDVAYRAAIDQLYRRSNTLRAEPADLDLEARYPVGMIVRGEIVRLGETSPVPNQRGTEGELLLDSGLYSRIPADEFGTGHGHVVGNLMRATVLSANTARQQVTVTLETGEAAASRARRALVREVAHRLGLIDQFRDQNNLRNVVGKARQTLPARLEEAARTLPWLAWAILRVVRAHTGMIIGTGQAARRDIEAENEVVLAADDGDVYLLGGSEEQVRTAIEGVRRRMGWERSVEEVYVSESSSVHSASDLYAAMRQEPASQVAAIPEINPVGTGTWMEAVGSRLARLFGLS